MKNSGVEWIAEIPGNWELRPLKFILQERSQKNNPIISEEILSLSIDKGVTLYADKTTNKDRFKEDLTQYKLAYPNDIVVNSMNVIVGAVGKSKYMGCVSPVYYVLYSSDDKKYDIDYYDYIFKSAPLRKVLFSLGRGIMSIEKENDRINTCRLKVSNGDLKRLTFPVPPFHLQQKIANFLDDKCADIDQLITLQQQMIDELKAYKQSVITEAVCKGLDKSVPMKNSGIEWIGEVPIHSEICAFRRLVNKYDGGLIRSNEELNRGVVPYFKMNNIDVFGNCSFQDLVLTDANNDEIEKYSLGDDDFLINVRNSYELVGKVGLVKNPPKNIVFNHMINRVVLNKTLIYPTFLKYYFVSNPLKFEYSFYKKGTTSVVALYKNDILKLHIILYPLSAQKDISDYLDQKCAQIDNLISTKLQKIDELKEYKKSMIYEYITGKKQVPN